jgi:hypothetical protein
VETFLCILGEEEVQRELDGAVRNEKVFQLVSDRMVVFGFMKTTEQCHQKSKKLSLLIVKRDTMFLSKQKRTVGYV